jgi:hypothetical protein
MGVELNSRIGGGLGWTSVSSKHFNIFSEKRTFGDMLLNHWMRARVRAIISGDPDSFTSNQAS